MAGNNAKMEQQQQQTQQDNSPYLEELKIEMRQTNPNSHAGRLLQAEISRIEKGESKERVVPWIEVHPNNPQPFSLRVRIPVKEHPRFNFVGKLLGPKGSSLKRLQEETGTKMSILGKNSMRDKAREDELRKEGGKYSHLNDDLHVYLETFSEMTDNFARISHAVNELKKFMQPEYNDDIRQQQMQDMMFMSNGEKGMGAPPGRGGRGGGGAPPGGPGGPGNFRGAPRGGRGSGLMAPPPAASRGAPGMPPRGRGGPGRGRGVGQPSRGMPAPRGRPAPPPAPVPQQSFDEYSGHGNSDYPVQSGYEEYGHNQSQYTEPEYDSSYGGGGSGDTQYFDYGHGTGSATGGYEDYGHSDTWGGNTGPVKPTRGAPKGQFRSHPYNQRGGY